MKPISPQAGEPALGAAIRIIAGLGSRLRIDPRPDTRLTQTANPSIALEALEAHCR